MKLKSSIKLFSITLIGALSVFTFGFLFNSTPANAECDSSSDCQNICDCDCVSDDVKAAAGCPGEEAAPDLVTVILNVLRAVIGISSIVAVVFIIIGGISYMTSMGDPTKIKKARDTILYSVIGLLVCVLAFIAVNWVIGILPDDTEAYNDNHDSIAMNGASLVYNLTMTSSSALPGNNYNIKHSDRLVR